MTVITRAELQEFASGTRKGTLAEIYKRTARAAASATVFLSHSHEDRDIVEPTVNFLASLGVAVYVDWLDPGMPSVTNADTARRIREMIRLNRRFLLLATERSLGSRWVPWELGIADGIKRPIDLAVLPVAESAYRNAPNEYIHVYPRIERADNGDWYIFDAGQSRSSLTVKAWLLQPEAP